MLNFVNCRFWRFSRFKPLCVLLRIIVRQKGNNAILGLEIAKTGIFCGFSENHLFGEAKIGWFWHNPSCAWITALNRHFFAISLFIAADLPSWRHLCLIVWICCFPRNLFALSLPVVQICLMCFSSFHPFVPIVSSCLWFENRILNRLFACRIRCAIYWILGCACGNQF